MHTAAWKLPRLLQNGGPHWDFNGNSFADVLQRDRSGKQELAKQCADEQCEAVEGCGSWLSARYLEALASKSILHVSPLTSTNWTRPSGPKSRTNDGS
jgi:hypothetical protein